MKKFVEYFRAENGHRKTFIVSSNMVMAIDEAKKYFKSSADHIDVVIGWVVGDELFFEDPHCMGKQKKYVAFYVR